MTELEQKIIEFTDLTNRLRTNAVGAATHTNLQWRLKSKTTRVQLSKRLVKCAGEVIRLAKKQQFLGEINESSL